MQKPDPHRQLRKKLIIKVILLFPLALIVTGLLLFLPAWTFDYWQAWLFMGVIFVPFIFVVAYFIRHDPDFIVRRMMYREKEVKQKAIIKIAGIGFVLGTLACGFDVRYGWSNVPTAAVICADAIVFASYMFIFYVFKVNSYASRIIRVEKGQKVISNGPYAVIRHPMYAGSIVMYASLPVALGSWWALLLFIPVIYIFFPRIINEEEVLMRELDGYKDYMKKVKYRLIPGIW